MESHRIKLLSEAYFNGWLDFQKRSPWHDSREEVILFLISQKLASDILEVRTIRDTIIAAALATTGSNDSLSAANNTFKTYGKYKFPSLFKDVKLDNKKEPLSKNEINDILSEHRKIVEAFNKKKK